MQCCHCQTDIESRKINDLETELIQYKCGNDEKNIHIGCIYNHHTENRRNVGKKCIVCQGNNPDCKIEDVKATLEMVIQIKKLRLWDDLNF